MKQFLVLSSDLCKFFEIVGIFPMKAVYQCLKLKMKTVHAVCGTDAAIFNND